VDNLDSQVRDVREKIERESRTVGGVNTSSGFITFGQRRDAEICLRLQGLSTDADLWELYTPPEASDVLWNDLTQDDTAQDVRTALAYLLVIALFAVYMPCVVGITNLGKLINLGPLQPLWMSVAPTLGLQVMVAFLPTFLIQIFSNFFTLRSNAWTQHALQKWYYWFQVIFVLLATAVGQNARGFATTLATQPFAIFGLMADTMPYATHFYMSFTVTQWFTHAMNLTRYIPLMKFKGFLALYDEETARQMSEPEDQDYYGPGSRGARWAILMCITFVFGTLCPPINLLAFINFAIVRMVYGYLFVFAETKKTDLGGEYYVTMLLHTLLGLVIYCILMMGVLMRRGANFGPFIVSIFPFVYSIWAVATFQTKFHWLKLSLSELAEGKPVVYAQKKNPYTQPELSED